MRQRMHGRGLHPKVRDSSFRFWTFDDGEVIGVRELIGGTLPLIASGANGTPEVIQSIIGCRARAFNRLATPDNVLATADASGDSPTIQGAWTMHLWMRRTRDIAATQSAFGLIGNGGNETQAHNAQALIQFLSDDTSRILTENGAGVNGIAAFTDYDIPLERWVLYTVRKTIPSTATYELLINAEVVQTVTGVVNADGGTDPLTTWKCGGRLDGTSFSEEAPVDIASIHIYDEALPIADIKEDFRRGYRMDAFTHVDVKVEVEDGNGQRRDLTDLDGVDFVDTVTINESVDNAVHTCDVKMLREQGDLSVAHLRTDSKLNLTDVNDVESYDQLIEATREIEVFCGRVPLGIRASGLDWQSRFFGKIDAPDNPANRSSISARGSGGKLVDVVIEEEVLNSTIIADAPPEEQPSYGDPAGQTLQSCIQDILDDNDNDTGNNTVSGLLARAKSYDPVTLVVEGAPNWSLLPWRQKRVPVLTAIRGLSGQIGWECRYRHNEGLLPDDDAWELTLYTPDRDRLDSDMLLTAREVESVPKLGFDAKGIRNVVRVTYPSSELSIPTPASFTGYMTTRFGWSSVDGAGNRLPAFVELEHIASRDRFDRKFMEIGEQSSSQIDTADEAVRMAFAMAEDLKEPDLEKGTSVPCLFETELNDVIRFEVIRQLYTVIQKLAVVSLSHSLGDMATTTLQMRGKAAVGFKRWLRLETRPGMGRPAVIDPRLALTDSSAGPLLRVLREIMDKSDLGTGGKYFVLKNQDMQFWSAGIQNPPDAWFVSAGTWNTDMEHEGNSAFIRTGGNSVQFNNTTGRLKSRATMIESDGNAFPSFSFELSWYRNATTTRLPSLTVIWLDINKAEIRRTLLTPDGSTTTNEVSFDTITDVDDVGDDITAATFDVRWDNGDSVIYFKDGGTDAIGLTDLVQYYVRQVAGDDFSIHPTRADAIANTAKIVLTDGTGETHRLVKQPDFGPAQATANVWFNSRVDGLLPPATARFVQLEIGADQGSGADTVWVDKVAGYRTSRAALTMVDLDEISWGAASPFGVGTNWNNVAYGQKRNSGFTFFGYDRGASMLIDETLNGSGWHYLAREGGTTDVNVILWVIVDGAVSASRTWRANLVKNAVYNASGVRTGGTIIASDTLTETFTNIPSEPLRIAHTVQLDELDTLTVDLRYVSESTGTVNMTAAGGTGDEPSQFGIKLRGVD